MNSFTRSMIGAAALAALTIAPAAFADFNTAAQDWRDGKFTAAFNEFKSLAETGHPQAQYNLAEMYLHGNGPPSSFQMAYGWMSVAAAYGLGDAQTRVKEWASQATDLDRNRAKLLLEQFGPGAIARRLLPRPHCAPSAAPPQSSRFRTDDQVAVILPEAALEITAMVLTSVYIAADGYPRDVRIIEAFPRGVLEPAVLEAVMRSRFTPFTRDGAPVGSWVLHVRHMHPIGMDVMERDVRDHLRRVMRKAKGGDVPSQYLAGMTMRYWMKRTPSSVPAAIALIEEAASASLPEAQHHLGQFLLQARCEGSEDLARYWTHQAAVGGNIPAQIWLAHALLNDGDPAQAPGAIFWLERAVKSGDPSAARLLAFSLLQPAAGPDAKRALALSEGLSREYAFDPSGPLLRAAAQALLGDFAAAEAAQREAIERARELGWNLTSLEAALEDYRGGRVSTQRVVEVGSAQELIFRPSGAESEG